MALKGLFLGFLFLGTLSAAAYYFLGCCKTPEIPTLKTGWWGKGERGNYKENEAIRKFTINVPEKILKDLKEQLKSTIYPDPLENAVFEYGFNTNYLKEVVDYWTNKYDWTIHQAKMNKFEQFKTQIEGIDIHFMHVKPKSVPQGTRVLPLMLIHGWPGSFIEFLDIIPLLTTPRKDQDFVFEVIIPSIPGYGFSEAPHQMGFGQVETAQVFDKLMQRIGFKTYYVQGGDWGSLVASNMATLYPNKVKGMHVNMVFSNSPCFWFKWILGHFFPSLVVSSNDHWKLYPLGEKFVTILRESGYMHLQSTKPDTVGVALSNSPAGLAAYILEKFAFWTTPKGIVKPDGLLTEKFTLDQVLTNVMVYYVTGTITSSMRYYKEHFNERQQAYNMDKLPIKVPSGVAAFPNELMNTPENFVTSKFKQLVSYTDMPRGGHFAAFEEPNLLANDVWQFVAKVEKLPKTESK